ncbi:MAG TPA: LysM domain-containing protein [Polyangiales bacterium]|nr:LysM domain-containing protein [Polyangiales bacterium]
MMRSFVAWASLGLALAYAAPSRAEQMLVHVVRPSETLASIAELYYGDSKREIALVMENGLGGEGGSSIVVGMRLTIPLVRYHRVQAGETWAELAERYYGDVRRAFALLEANASFAGKQPDVGAEILIPHPLRYSGAHDPVRQASKDFGDGSNKAMQSLRRFNGLKAGRVTRNTILLVPVANLVLSAQGKKIAASQGLTCAVEGDARDKQMQVNDELPKLREHVQRGRYVEAVSLANRLLGMGQLTGNQVVTIERELGTALIALDREDLATEAFKIMLEKQPDVELGLGDTSPRVLHVLEAAKQALGTRPRAPVTASKERR